MWSFGQGHLVKIENRLSKSALYINNYYLYIVSNDRVPEIAFDQMTLTK